MPLRVFDIFCCAFLMSFDVKNCSVSMIISNHNLRYLSPTGGLGINHPICVDTRNIESIVGCFEKHIICINIMRLRIRHHQQMPVSGKLPAKTRQSDLTFLIKRARRLNGSRPGKSVPGLPSAANVTRRSIGFHLRGTAKRLTTKGADVAEMERVVVPRRWIARDRAGAAPPRSEVGSHL